MSLVLEDVAAKEADCLVNRFRVMCGLFLQQESFRKVWADPNGRQVWTAHQYVSFPFGNQYFEYFGPL
jgi:hypothetical protein